MDITSLCLVLEKTLSTKQEERKQAESYLYNMECMESYGPLILQICSQNNIMLPIRVASAISLKNLVKKFWSKDNENLNKLNDNDKVAIKERIIEIMLMTEPIVQRQICDCISIIGKEDFPHDWANFLPKLITHFSSNDFNAITGVLRTCHSLFKKYRFEFKSEKLWTEIKFVLDNFAPSLTILFEKCVETLQKESNQHLFVCVFEATIIICKIFYSLNYQDLPEFFEDNMERWMKAFLYLLSKDFTKFKNISGTNSDGDRMDILRSQICNNASLYVTKYEEEFQPYLNQFLGSIWSLLVETSAETNEIFSSNAIQFIASFSEKPSFKHLFEDKSTLEKICSSVIIPNIRLREIDEENFNDNPDEYIRQDVEGSDIDTRRKAVTELIRGLSVHFEGQIIEIFSKYLFALLQEYNDNPREKWRSKDIAIYLVISLASKKQTTKYGVTEVSTFINVTDFFNNFLVPDLQNLKICNPIILTDILKYIAFFRNILPITLLVQIVPFILNFLLHSTSILSIYACYLLDKLLSFEKSSSNHNEIKNVLIKHKDIVINNFLILLFSSTNFQNEYVIRALMKSIAAIGTEISNNINAIMLKLGEKLIETYKNPMKPNFIHYLFENICLSIIVSCQSNRSFISSFEQTFFPIFQDILSNDLSDFMPYVFQVLSLMLEEHQNIPIPSVYLQLLPLLVNPELWQRSGVIPGLTILINSYLKTMGNCIVESGRLTAILGVFQKLISSQTNDQHGMLLLSSLLKFIPWKDLQPFLKEILVILFQRLTNSKTVKFIKNFLIWICLYSSLRNPDEIIEMIDSIQPKLFPMVVEKLFSCEINKISESVDSKICIVGMVKFLCDSKKLFIDEYCSSWCKLLECLVGFLELNNSKSLNSRETLFDSEKTDGYEVVHSQLIYCKQIPTDPFNNITDVRKFFIENLKIACSKNPKIPSLINQVQVAQIIYSYMKHYGISLN